MKHRGSGPTSGDDFDLKSICEDYEVLNIADELDIDDDIVSDVPEELEEIANDALESYEFESWDVSEANFFYRRIRAYISSTASFI